MKKLVLIVGLALLGLTGCGVVNNALVEKHKTVEYYRIFDIRTQADRQSVVDAASNGLGKNVNDAKEASPIFTDELPDKPLRFKLVNPFQGSALGAFAAAGGNIGFKLATCDGAVWTANATRTVAGSNQLRLTACLFPYKDGYNLDLYATFEKVEGGVWQLSRSMASAMVGTPEEWTEKTFLDIVRNVHDVTKAEITYVEGYPKVTGTPWLDSGENIEASK